jgi:hypothetical protein
MLIKVDCDLFELDSPFVLPTVQKLYEKETDEMF